MPETPGSPWGVPDPEAITAVVLAGGRGARMGGADKGLQTFNGVPLALHALNRVAPQLGRVIISANRNLAQYRDFGVAAHPDPPGLGNYAGPLAGFLAGFMHCPTPYLLTVPCDVPLFPHDLVARLTAAFTLSGTQASMPALQEIDRHGLSRFRSQPAFCLMRRDLHAHLLDFTDAGGRKIADWCTQFPTRLVPFDAPSDDPRAFCNANTLAELDELERLGQTRG